MKFEKKKALPLLFIISSWLFLFQTNIPSVKASPGWLGSWDFRQSHVIENATGAGTDYQVYLNVYQTSGSSGGDSVYLNEHNASIFPNDLRFTGNDGLTLLDYWIEASNSSWAGVWVEVADDLSTADQTICVYYGKSGQSSTSSGNNTFLLFDDFLGASLDTSKWNYAGSPSVANSNVTLTGTEEERIHSISTFGLGTAVRGFGKLDTRQIWSGYNIIGYGDGTPLNDTNAVFLYSYHAAALPDTYLLTGRSRASSTQTNVAMDENESPAWRKWDVMRPSSYKCQFRVADGNTKETTTNIPSGSYYVQLWARQTIDITEFDWVLVRNYVSPEPTHGSWGSEEGTHEIEATVDLDPDTLNLRSEGRSVTAYIELPQGYDVGDIDVSSIRLNGTFPVDPDAPTQIGDYDDDGVPDLMVKFNRTELTAYLYNILEVRLDTVVLIVSGELIDGTLFEASDTVRTRLAGDVNEDCVVDVTDLSMVGRSFGARMDEEGYEDRLDLTCDGVIDMRDLLLIGINYGAIIPE